MKTKTKYCGELYNTSIEAFSHNLVEIFKFFFFFLNKGNN